MASVTEPVKSSTAVVIYNPQKAFPLGSTDAVADIHNLVMKNSLEAQFSDYHYFHDKHFADEIPFKKCTTPCSVPSLQSCEEEFLKKIRAVVEERKLVEKFPWVLNF